MNEFVERVQNRDYYRDQIRFQRDIPARRSVTRSCTTDSLITDQLADRGIDERYAHQTDAIETVRNGQNVVLATPTASGKSLTMALADPNRQATDSAPKSNSTPAPKDGT